MAEPLLGLTRPAAKLLGDMADEFRQRLPDQGRRTRRVYPPRGNGLTLLKYTSTDHLLGAVDGDGIEATGECEVVSDLGTTYDVTAGTYFHGLIIPQMQFWGIKDGDEYRVVYGGVHMLTGPCTGDGDTTITVGEIDVQFFNPCSEEFAEGQYLTLGVSYGTASDTQIGLVVLRDCCPPDPE